MKISRRNFLAVAGAAAAAAALTACGGSSASSTSTASSAAASSAAASGAADGAEKIAKVALTCDTGSVRLSTTAPTLSSALATCTAHLWHGLLSSTPTSSSSLSM